MTKQEHIEYWLRSAEHDLETAESLLSNGKYDWALFLGHLVLEKSLKALFVFYNDNKIPPKVHNLVKLAELFGLNLDLDNKEFLDKVNDFNLEVRYPEYKNEFYVVCTKEFAEEYMTRIKEELHWIKSRLK
ncbi:MAG: HEPN domain-containing protein [Melioribacteraceae bacterium]